SPRRRVPRASTSRGRGRPRRCSRPSAPAERASVDAKAVSGLFVTGTGTDVGKTVLSAALLAAIAAAGEPVRAHKPVVTGLDERPQSGWPPDHELLASVAGMRSEEVAPLRYGPAVAPDLAARLAGEAIDPTALVERARTAAAGEETLI